MIKGCFILEPSDYEVLVSIFKDMEDVISGLHDSDEKETLMDKAELGKFVLGAGTDA